MADVKALYRSWMEHLKPESPLYRELEAIKDDPQEITERFYKEIEFGTAGLRGICGAGVNRMNEYTVGRATQGIASFMLKSGKDYKKGVVIAYDCRYFSKEFSEMAAEILAGNGIPSYIFPSLRPTPELSFAIRKLGALSGINMTASHNPKEYNGYKVYWEDGAQISGQISDGMQAEILKRDLFDPPKRMPMEEAVKKGIIHMLGEEMDRMYLDYIKNMAQRPDEELDLSIPVVYTPLNGAGSIAMMQSARERGFDHFVIVPEQKDPDPDFTTVPFPNPENPKAFELAEKLGRECQAEVLIATDPDSDRMAVEVRDEEGNYVALNGNQTGALLIAYMAQAQAEKGKLPPKAAMIKSIVTSDLGRAICRDYGIAVFETLTGFKNICGKIPEIEKEGYTYFFGYEESIGCAPGDAVRDKDGICAGMLITEMAAYYRKKGMSVLRALEEIYKKYGYYADGSINIVLEGREGKERIERMMAMFRGEKPDHFGKLQVKEIIDFIAGYQDIPAQNAMIFKMTDGSWVAMRPSGTEPKLKFYYYAVASEKEQSEKNVEVMKKAVVEMIDRVS